MTEQERVELLVNKHGEVCTRTDAAKILSKCRQTINAMLADGRLDSACAGDMVDVRSIARYIMAPRQADFEVHKRNMQRKHKSEWAV